MSKKLFEKYVAETKQKIAGLTATELDSYNQEMHRNYQEAYGRFRNNFDNGKCSFCGKALKTFSPSRVCLHWLLRPKGIKKKHIKEVLDIHGFFDVDTYLRWVANTEGYLKNINDLNADKRMHINTTIKYKHLEWSFSCAYTDLQGHGETTNFPHFHFQFRIDKRQFINFNEYHIRFKDHDLWRFAMLDQNEFPYEYNHGYGIGMYDVFNDEAIEEVMNDSVLSENEDEALFSTETLIVAKPGETISGDDLADLLIESKATGVPMSRLATKLDANVTTYVSEGKGVVTKASRTKNKPR